MRLKGLFLAIAVCAAAPALAQSPFFRVKPRPPAECVFDHCDPPAAAPAPRPAAPAQRIQQGGEVAPGKFDFYVLALSWSPGFCDTGGGAKAQCDPGSNLGFVVHGLWPQNEHGFPSDCGGPEAPRSALALTRGVFPDEGLARYEWRKHGTCTGKTPESYFADIRQLRDSIKIPDAFVAPRESQTVAPGDVLRAFSEVNPQLRAGMGAIGCTRGELVELRLCLDKDLRGFRPCPEVARQSCRARQIAVPPVR